MTHPYLEAIKKYAHDERHSSPIWETIHFSLDDETLNGILVVGAPKTMFAAIRLVEDNVAQCPLECEPNWLQSPSVD